MALSHIAAARPEVPRYDEHGCAFDGAEALGSRVACGTLVVPESYAHPDDGPVVNVAVAVVKAAAPDAQPDPLVYLSGGPGEPAIASAASWAAHPAARSRDIVLLDQRGTGRSDPLCPDLAEQLVHIMAEDLTPEEDVARNRKAAADCLAALESRGVDPSAYGSATTAADLDALRGLLGYEKWNLLGVSYGTRLALTAMRDVPRGIRSVVLDSPFAPQDDFHAMLRGSFAPAVDRLAGDCARHDGCAREGGEVDQEISALLDMLDTTPVVLRVDEPDLFPSGRIVINRQDMEWLLRLQLRDAGVRAVLPALVRAWRRGHTESLATLVKVFARMWSTIDVGKYYAVQCLEEMPFSASPSAAGPPIAFLDATASVCADWNLPAAPARENEPVESAIPTLLLAGELDFGTSHASALRTARHLPRSTVLQVPGAGHSVGGHGCTGDVIASFVDAPLATLESSCLASHPAPPPMGALRPSPGPLELLRGLEGDRPMDLIWIAITLLLLAIAVVLWPLRALWRWYRKADVDAPPPRLKTIAHASLGLAAGVAWVFAVGLASAMAELLKSDYAVAVLAGLPGDTTLLFLLPKAAALLVVGAVVAAALSWRSRSWSRLERVHYVLTLVSGVAFLVFLGTKALI
jgi:pimeloyl-ACP methyl ester carboxylesterase